MSTQTTQEELQELAPPPQALCRPLMLLFTVFVDTVSINMCRLWV
jgi:hypothetical protein